MPRPDRSIPSGGPVATLLRRRWSAPILAELHRRRGSRFAALANSLGVPRPTLRRTLDGLIAAGWVMPNPGYGHPLRPEYVLTARGRSVAAACADLCDLLASMRATEVGLRRWTLSIVAAAGTEARRFGELRRLIPGITDRSLVLALRSMEGMGLVARAVVDGSPPGVQYRVAERARPLVEAVRRL